MNKLTGSEKQIEWASRLRDEMLRKIEAQAALAEKGMGYGALRWMPKIHAICELDRPQERVAAALDLIRAQDRAGWWIDMRYTDPDEILYSHVEAVRLPDEQAQAEAEKEVEAAARLEVAVFPEKRRTETLAEIRVVGDRIEVELPEFHDDFRDMMHENLYQWDRQKRCWTRTPAKYRGPIEHRAAEIAHKILAWGAPICCFTDTVRLMAVDASYTPDTTRWVTETDGKFSIRWDRKWEDFYAVAKRISGSRWHSDSRSMIVPPEQFLEVLDFAQIHDFRLSPGAQALVETQRTAYENAPVVTPPEPTEPKRREPGQKPPKLTVPEDVDIDDDLKDDAT